jgi:hypothetical protein
MAAVLSCGLSVAQSPSWQGILDPTRAIDWTVSGVPGGIPNRSTVCASLSASTYGNGASDATAGIQAALNTCPSNQVVSLSAGKFRINTSVQIPSNVSLRGQGPAQTILDLRGSGAAGITFGTGVEPNFAGATVDITGGMTAGSKSITVSNATNFAVGKYLTINQLNDTYVTNVGEGGQVCSWCDPFNGARLQGQIVEITSVSGTTIGITPGLYRTYDKTPRATLWTAGAKYAGLENLQVYSNNTGYTAVEMMNATAYCWIKGVMNNFADGDHVRAFNSYRGEIRESYFSNAFNHQPGSTDADVFLAKYTSGFLVESNILERLHSSIMLNWGPSGNVIAYNYSLGAYSDTATYLATSDIVMHGAHPAYNLFEGNVGTNFTADSTWGSSSHNTLFRNWWKGTTKVATPLTGRGTIDWKSATWAVQHVRGIELCFAQRYFNFVGNAVGSAETAALKAYNVGAALSQQAMVVAPASRSYDAVAYGYTFGYSGASDDGAAPEDNGLSYSTLFLHGDYEYSSNGVTWNTQNQVRTLPASFFRSSKPAWFGSTPWPPIGPDVTGGVGARGKAYLNPAAACYETGSKTADGMLNFDPIACYSPAVLPAPPVISTVSIK